MNQILINFYRNEDVDTTGHMLQEMWQWSDHVLEAEHDYIQWMFPTVTPSAFNSGSPLLDEETVKVWREDSVLQNNLITSFNRFLDFLQLAMDEQGVYPLWEGKPPEIWSYFNHNFLRITRVLESLRILGKRDEAEKFLEWLERFAEKNMKVVSENTLEFWRKTTDG